MAQKLSHKKVLIVEDSQDTRDLICLVLRRAGARVTCAENGQEGLKKALKSTPDILLLDLEMPELSGFGVIKELRSQHFTNPILAITSHTTLEDKDRCEDAGFDGYIGKPFDKDRLVSILHSHLLG